MGYCGLYEKYIEFESQDGIEIHTKENEYCEDIVEIMNDSVRIYELDQEAEVTIKFTDIKKVYNY